MTAPGATGRRSATARLAGIGVAAAAVAVALYVAGRLHTPDYTFSLFGRVGLDALMLKSTLASIALGVAALQVLLALWMYANCRWRSARRARYGWPIGSLASPCSRSPCRSRCTA